MATEIVGASPTQGEVAVGVTDDGRLKVDIVGETLAIDTTGLATSANQTTANTSLASLDTKTPAKGTAAMAGSSPVTIATDDAIRSDLDPVAGTAAPFQVALGASQTLTAGAAKRFVRICAPIANANPAYIDCSNGTASASRGDELNPGDTKDYPVTNANKISVFGTSPDKLNVTVF